MEGIVYTQNKKMSVDCYAYEKNSGSYGYKNPQDPICLNSRIGYAINFMAVYYYGSQSFKQK